MTCHGAYSGSGHTHGFHIQKLGHYRNLEDPPIKASTSVASIPRTSLLLLAFVGRLVVTVASQVRIAMTCKSVLACGLPDAKVSRILGCSLGLSGGL